MRNRLRPPQPLHRGCQSRPPSRTNIQRAILRPSTTPTTRYLRIQVSLLCSLLWSNRWRPWAWHPSALTSNTVLHLQLRFRTSCRLEVGATCSQYPWSTMRFSTRVRATAWAWQAHRAMVRRGLKARPVSSYVILCSVLATLLGLYTSTIASNEQNNHAPTLAACTAPSHRVLS